MKRCVKSGNTEIDRYPDLFLAAKLLSKENNQMILSFGCSVGEEPYTLKTKYFVDSKVYGTDAHSKRLKKAKKKFKDINFLSTEDMGSMENSFDIIFCMNVFANYKDGIDSWKNDVMELIRYMKKDGLLCIQNCTYGVDQYLNEYLEEVDVSHVVPSVKESKKQFKNLYDGKWKTHIFYRMKRGPMIEQLQKSTHTKYNRYPLIFSALKLLIPNPKKILSFGCSSGKEMLSLKELYFSDAEYHGVDTKDDVIQACKDRCNFATVHHVKNFDTTLKFDLIICMSVFCHYKRGHDMWVKDILKIVNMLSRGGYLAMHNCTYTLDTSVDFKMLEEMKIPEHILNNKSFRDYNKYDRCVIFKKE